MRFLCNCGQVLTILFVRELGLGHYADRKAEDGNIRGVSCKPYWSTFTGLRVALPAARCAVPAETVTAAIQAIRLDNCGLAVVENDCGVGYAMVINMMASKPHGHFSLLFHALAAVTELNLIAIRDYLGLISLYLCSNAPEFNQGLKVAAVAVR